MAAPSAATHARATLGNRLSFVGNNAQQLRDTIASDRCDDPELREMRSDRIDHRCLLAHEQVTGTVKRQAALLLDVFVGTNRMLVLATASQIASASTISFFCRFT